MVYYMGMLSRRHKTPHQKEEEPLNDYLLKVGFGLLVLDVLLKTKLLEYTSTTYFKEVEST
jgi:hypothetical protein